MNNGENAPSELRLLITPPIRTLASMFPDLDRDIIDDVVRMKEGRYEIRMHLQYARNMLIICGRVGLAVEACLALNA